LARNVFAATVTVVVVEASDWKKIEFPLTVSRISKRMLELFGIDEPVTNVFQLKINGSAGLRPCRLLKVDPFRNGTVCG
jgi:hypothetical protein